jgi:hypothetical protein
VTFIGKGGLDKLMSSLTEAADRFKLQGVCFAGNRDISGGQLGVISF